MLPSFSSLLLLFQFTVEIVFPKTNKIDNKKRKRKRKKFFFFFFWDSVPI